MSTIPGRLRLAIVTSDGEILDDALAFSLDQELRHDDDRLRLAAEFEAAVRRVRALRDVREITSCPALIAEARAWVADCASGDPYGDPADVDTISDERVARLVARHYDGGIDAFVLASSLAAV